MCVFLIGWVVISSMVRMISILSLLSKCFLSSIKPKWFSVVPWTVLTLCDSKACRNVFAIHQSTNASSWRWFFIILWWLDPGKSYCIILAAILVCFNSVLPDKVIRQLSIVYLSSESLGCCKWVFIRCKLRGWPVLILPEIDESAKCRKWRRDHC